jgi:hypothetical protein
MAAKKPEVGDPQIMLARREAQLKQEKTINQAQSAEIAELKKQLELAEATIPIPNPITSVDARVTNTTVINTDNSTTTNCTTNNVTNITNNILVLNVFGSENTEYLDKDYFVKALGEVDTASGLLGMVARAIWAHSSHPENWNIKSPNSSATDRMEIIETNPGSAGKHWAKSTTNEVAPRMFKRSVDVVSDAQYLFEAGHYMAKLGDHLRILDPRTEEGDPIPPNVPKGTFHGVGVSTWDLIKKSRLVPGSRPGALKVKDPQITELGTYADHGEELSEGDRS